MTEEEKKVKNPEEGKSEEGNDSDNPFKHDESDCGACGGCGGGDLSE